MHAYRRDAVDACMLAQGQSAAERLQKPHAATLLIQPPRCRFQLRRHRAWTGTRTPIAAPQSPSLPCWRCQDFEPMAAAQPDTALPQSSVIHQLEGAQRMCWSVADSIADSGSVVHDLPLIEHWNLSHVPAGHQCPCIFQRAQHWPSRARHRCRLVRPRRFA